MTKEIKSSGGKKILGDFPSFEDVSPFKELLYEKLASVILDTRAHFAESGHRHDVPGFFAKHVRSALQDSLEPEAETYAFSIDTSTGSFLIAYKQYLMKLYKAYNGMFPTPSRDNKARQRFLNHNQRLVSRPQLPGFEEVGGISTSARIHLIAYYDLDSKHNLAWLRIACPLSVTASGVDWLWNKPVESSPFSVGIQPKEYSTQERPDIPYSLLEEDNDDLAEDSDDSSELG